MWRDFRRRSNKAYIGALASAAGYTLAQPEVDDDSIDIIFKSRARHGTRRGPSLDAQLKATSHLNDNGSEYTFDLPLKNYDDLRDTDLTTPRILIVMQLPTNCDDWISCNDNYIELRKRAYWVSLCGHPKTANRSVVRIRLPKANVFNVEALHIILNKIGHGITL